MGLWAASHNGLNQSPKTSELKFDSMIKKNNELRALAEDKAKSLIEDDTKTDNVDLTNGMSEEEAIDKYIAGLSDGEKNNLIKDLLGSAVDSVVNFFANNEVEETPTVDPKTVEDTAKDTTMIAENEAPTEDAEVDPMTAKVMEYAELDDMALASKLNAVNSQLAGLEDSLDTLTQMYEAGKMTNDEFATAFETVNNQINECQNEKAIIEAAKVYKEEAKIIEKMTPEQKAELEAINNEMTPIMEKIEDIYQKLIDATEKYIDAQQKVVSGEISQENYTTIENERDSLSNMLDNLYSQLAPLQEKRQALFDNAGKVDETATASNAEEVPDIDDIRDRKNNIEKNILDDYTYGTTDGSEDPATTEGGEHKTLADKLRDSAESGFSFGIPTSTTSTTSTTTTKTTKKSDEKEAKTISNFFTKVADGVKSDDLEGVLDAMAKKGLSETFTNATKVGDNAGVDFTRRQFLRAMDERLI